MSNLKAFIFIGKSGCGKGTQAKLLEEFLKINDSINNSFYLETGKIIRDFIKGDGYTEVLARKIYEEGGLQPEFISVHMWSHLLVNDFRSNMHLIVDGTPRRLHEAGALDSVFEFYSIKEKHVIFIETSNKWSVERLMARGRLDDNEEDITERLNWYIKDVMPAIEFYKNNMTYKFHNINGEQSIKDVSKDILKSLDLKFA